MVFKANASNIDFNPNDLVYAPNGSTLAGLPTAVSSFLITDAFGVPQWANSIPPGLLTILGTANQITVTTVGTVSTISLPNTLIAPGTFSVGTYTFNGIDMSTSGAMQITSAGGISLNPGPGQAISLIRTGGGTAPLQFYNSAQTFLVSFQAQTGLLANVVWILPGTDANGFWKSDGAGNLSIVPIGAVTWTSVTGATQTLATENGYITNRGAGVTYLLPATANLGDEIKVVGKLGLSTITQNANQQILISSSSSSIGVGGSIAGTNVGDCITLICITSGASTVWRAESVVGNWTVV